MSEMVALEMLAPLTTAARSALHGVGNQAMLADLLFLERWEMAPVHGAAAALRVSQIRRANPELAAAVRAEISKVLVARG
jgi:hypothetical protein